MRISRIFVWPQKFYPQKLWSFKINILWTCKTENFTTKISYKSKNNSTSKILALEIFRLYSNSITSQFIIFGGVLPSVGGGAKPAPPSTVYVGIINDMLQSEVIDNIADMAVETTENVKMGNEEVRQVSCACL